jgi:hypothetical protein
MSDYDKYRPAPIDTSHVALPRDLLQLREKLAANVHELWAASRMADGWVYGPKRDDAQKAHPGLVPYERLPESEKDYDRLMAMETLKTILALGFRIVQA